MGLTKKLKCDCCGTETLAEIRENKLIIIDKRHGRKHMLVLTIEEILTAMEDLAGEDGLTRLQRLTSLSMPER